MDSDSFTAFSQSRLNKIFNAQLGTSLVFVGIDDVTAGHGDAEWAERVQNTNCPGVRAKDIGETPIGLKGFIENASAQEGLSVGAPFPHLIMPNKPVLANPFISDCDKASPGRGPGNDSAGAVNSGEQRCA